MLHQPYRACPPNLAGTRESADHRPPPHPPAAPLLRSVRAIPDVTRTTLLQQLRALERDGVVRRIVYDEMQPHMQYEPVPSGAGYGVVPGAAPVLNSGEATWHVGWPPFRDCDPRW
ncbi:winged helix-turn-helix transcriptional regulator [Streptomyces sp. NPDC029080]|uniref:winged helix-turn-helix transcriptional regulator n=1 Tax=Streptomyces sp. NPDC029080 TaxID=3155017 RepID=UPI003407162A